MPRVAVEEGLCQEDPNLAVSGAAGGQHSERPSDGK